MTETVRKTKVTADDRELTVSTVKLGPNRYDTVVFDDSSDSRNAGKAVGRYVIDSLNVPSATREEAMDVHRDALIAARREPIRELTA